MAKSTIQYWNPLLPMNKDQWKPVEGMDGLAEELTLAIDEESGDYTRLTRFMPGADTTPFGPKSHRYPEEIYILEGRLYDEAFGKWLEVGDYASRPPEEIHGPFKTETGCLVLEISFPGKSVNNDMDT
jgi:hypothetical protein